jgi:hypothetical protein
MGALRKSLWTIAAITALPAPAAAQQICNAMNRIAAAARETPPFGSIRRALAHREAVVPGFSAERCRASATGIDCSLFQRSDQEVDWNPEISCPGFSPVEPLTGGEAASGGLVRRYGRQERTYTGFGLRISFGLDCVRCNPPSTSYFRVAFQEQARPEE